MSKKIVFSNSNHQTEISMVITKDIDEPHEVMIEVGTDNPWYSFTSAKELQEFIDELQVLQIKLKELQ